MVIHKKKLALQCCLHSDSSASEQWLASSSYTWPSTESNCLIVGVVTPTVPVYGPCILVDCFFLPCTTASLPSS